MLENKLKNVKYPQPHNIYVVATNEAMEQHMIMKIHGRLKYEAKYRRHKQQKRLYQ